jgi:DNA-binding XRE family transcriptional regulator
MREPHEGSAVRERISQRMRARRYALGLSAAELSARTGVARSVIANWEVGRTNLTVDDYFALGIALGAEPDVFMRETVCARCSGLPPQGYTCADCGAGDKRDPCMACKNEPPEGFICRACGAGTTPEERP